MIDKAHHFAYALAAVIIAVVGFYFFKPDHKDVTLVTPKQENVVPPAGSVRREIQAAIESAALNAALRSPVIPAFEHPAVNVVQPLLKGFSAAEVAGLLHALGTQKTQPVIHVGLVGPTPGPVLTPPPDISKADADFHHQDTFNAVAEAIEQSHIKVDVTQEPVPPSRIESLVLADHAAGIVYAVRRKKQLDLDLGVVQRDGVTSPVAGVGYRLKSTQAGAFLGVMATKGHPKLAAGFTVSF